MIALALRYSIIFILALSACSSTPTTTASGPICYQAQSQREYNRYLQKVKRLEAFKVKGKKYECVENATPVEAVCYMAKNKKEYLKLSKQQEKHPDQLVQIGKKHYRCIQNKI